MLDLWTNFRTEGSPSVCRRYESAEETQVHLLSCPSLDTDRILQASLPPVYDDLLGTNIRKLEIISRIIASRYKLFTDPSAPLWSAAVT